EERGQVRRGYFVAGLGAAQFSLPGAVDRLRDVRDGPDGLHPELAPGVLILAATDPAQPYGGTLPWPENSGRPARAAGALVVLSAGRAVAWLDQRSHNLLMFPGGVNEPGWADAVAALVKDGRVRAIEIRKLDGEAVPVDGPVVDALKRVGFVDGYRGLMLRP
ncbi:MAG TPA: DEAD/DEAH box helicase, partial [Ilumatobacteraceae bacterium]